MGLLYLQEIRHRHRPEVHRGTDWTVIKCGTISKNLCKVKPPEGPKGIEYRVD